MRVLVRAGFAGLMALTAAEAAWAGPIFKACSQSARSGATPALCQCVQQVADQTLARADQRRAAGFFKNPEKAQATFLSKRRSDDAFWERYKRFGETAETLCRVE